MAGTGEALGDGVVVAPAAMCKRLVRARRKLPDGRVFVDLSLEDELARDG
jgi:predicted RNA polymerase sigma factor